MATNARASQGSLGKTVKVTREVNSTGCIYLLIGLMLIKIYRITVAGRYEVFARVTRTISVTGWRSEHVTILLLPQKHKIRIYYGQLKYFIGRHVC